MQEEIEAASGAILEVMTTAWNRGDGLGFAEAFADDADFVNVYGAKMRGQVAIAAAHQGILTTVYKGSTCAFGLEHARPLAPTVALIHGHADLDVPAGPMQGRHEARFTMLMTGGDGQWRIAAFHNTFIRSPPGAPPS